MTGWAYPPERSREPERLGLPDFLAVLALPWLEPCNGGVTDGPCVVETEPAPSGPEAEAK
jgi:hypothetical protein